MNISEIDDLEIEAIIKHHITSIILEANSLWQSQINIESGFQSIESSIERIREIISNKENSSK